jgi:glycosyltransferase involved in cell wall biosynthesis
VPTETVPQVGFLIQDLEYGGVERCFLNLARGFVSHGVGARLYTVSDRPGALRKLDPRVKLIRLRAFSRRQRVWELATELTHLPPRFLLAAKDEDCDLALEVRSHTRPVIPVALVASLNFTAELDGRGANPWQRWRRYRLLRSLYGRADRIFCVSRGVAQDLARILACDPTAFEVLPNPVVTPELADRSAQPLGHPWFAPGQPPVVLGVGRLSRIKNFSLLVRAFARVRGETALRLMVLGEGKQRGELERLAARLKVKEDLALPGHVENPYGYMHKASLFVLSSLWEGFGNVVVEALACGTPVVATDCPSGPAEILEDGRYGLLVPNNDELALAAAMLQCLRSPLPKAMFKEAVRPYTLENSSRAYLRALGLAEYAKDGDRERLADGGSVCRPGERHGGSCG